MKMNSDGLNSRNSTYVNPQPFTCYFCKKYIETETEFGHISICGNVLEPCSNKCGSYVPRNMKAKHMKECLNRKPKLAARVTFQDDEFSDFARSNVMANGTATLGRRRIPSNSSNESQQATRAYQPEFAKFLQKIQSLDQQIKQLVNNFETTKTKINEDCQTLQRNNSQNQLNLEKIQYQNQLLLDWKRNIEIQIENLREEANKSTKYKHEFETQIFSLQNKLLLLDKLNNDQKSYADKFLKEQISTRETQNDLRAHINDLRDYFMQENAAISAVWNDHAVDIQSMKQNITSIRKSMDESKAKYNALVFDTRTVTQITAETSEKLDIQERTISEMRKDITQLKVDIEALEARIYGETTSAKIGRLLWKVADFSRKLQDAKDDDVVFKSPAFYTHEFGYRIRLNVYLNGLKKWKGRHMLACLYVLKGEYDELLKWPCSIEGTIALRDVQDKTYAKSFTKSISARRHIPNEESEDPHESSNQYIFVPHTTLLKDCFVKNDTLFIDIRIKKPNISTDETEI